MGSDFQGRLETRSYSGDIRMWKMYSALAAAALMTACTSTGNIERNAAGGAAVGAVAGAIIGNNVGDGDADRGAAIGAAVGGAAGAARGASQDRAVCGRTEARRPYSEYGAGQELLWDASASKQVTNE